MEPERHSRYSSEDELLAGAEDFNCRLRNYLYLPFMIMGTLVSPQGFIALSGNPLEDSVYAKSIVPVTVAAYLLWWLSRKLRWWVFWVNGAFLLVVGLLASLWAIVTLLGGNSWLEVLPLPEPILFLYSVTWILFVPPLIGGAGWKSVRTALLLRRLPAKELPEAIASARERVRSADDEAEEED